MRLQTLAFLGVRVQYPSVLDLEDHRGKWIVVSREYFYAAFCDP